MANAASLLRDYALAIIAIAKVTGVLAVNTILLEAWMLQAKCRQSAAYSNA